MPDIIEVTAFIDWNTQIFAARAPRSCTHIEVAQRTMSYVGRTISRVLNDIMGSARFSVTLRIYHGWHQGFKVTDRRKAMIQLAAMLDYASLSERLNVQFRPEIQYGDLLISALPSRLHTRLACHLPNTLRWSLNQTNELEEKMVDTALASDIVDLAHREPTRWLMVLAKDDDMVPPVFVAEAAVADRGGRIVLARSRADTPFLRLDEIGFRI